MLIVKVKKGEKIEMALKRWKNKVRKTRLNNEIRERKEHVKKSVKRRAEIDKAKYIQKIKNSEKNS